MSGEDRIKELKDFLESTLNEFETLFKGAGGPEESQKGNGWIPDKIPVETFVVPSLPIDKIISIGESKKTALFELPVISFVRPHSASVQRLAGPIAWYVPYWKIKGFHECFYFRGNAYKLRVPDDVLAVQIENRVLDVIPKLRDTQGAIAKIKSRIARGGTAEVSERLLRIGNVTELAYLYNEGYIITDGKGGEDVEAEVFLTKDIPFKRVKDPEEDAPAGYPFKVVRPEAAKEEVVKTFHERIVKAPAAFQKILSNKFEISTLSLIYVPHYEFIYGFAGRVKRLVLHGHTGEKVDDFPVLKQLAKVKL